MASAVMGKQGQGTRRPVLHPIVRTPHLVRVGAIEVHVIKQGNALCCRVPVVLFDVQELDGLVLLAELSKCGYMDGMVDMMMMSHLSELCGLERTQGEISSLAPIPHTLTSSLSYLYIPGKHCYGRNHR